MLPRFTVGNERKVRLEQRFFREAGCGISRRQHLRCADRSLTAEGRAVHQDGSSDEPKVWRLRQQAVMIARDGDDVDLQIHGLATSNVEANRPGTA